MSNVGSLNNLGNFLVENRSTWILLPRFTLASEALPLLIPNLEEQGFEPILADDNNLVTSNSDATGSTVIIYSSPEIALNNRIDNKPPYTIILLEWGFDSDMVRTVNNNFNGIVSLAIRFYRKPRQVDFKTVSTAMSDKAASVYSSIVNSEIDYSAKWVAGNHYFSDISFDQIQDLLESNRPEEELGGNVSLSEIMQSNGPAGANFAASVEGSDNPDLSAARNNPKAGQIASAISQNKGKYVIYTSNGYSYGARLFRYILQKIFGASPLMATDKKSKDVFEQFERSSTNLIITTVVPPITLTNVRALVVTDTYNPDMVTAVLKRLCSQGCGQISITKNEGKDGTDESSINIKALSCVFLVISYPDSNKHPSSSVDQKKARKAIEQLQEKDSEYAKLVEKSAILDYADFGSRLINT